MQKVLRRFGSFVFGAFTIVVIVLGLFSIILGIITSTEDEPIGALTIIAGFYVFWFGLILIFYRLERT
jgi:hypothetical protein